MLASSGSQRGMRRLEALQKSSYGWSLRVVARVRTIVRTPVLSQKLLFSNPNRHTRLAPWRTDSWLLQLLRGSIKVPNLSRTHWSMSECTWPGREPSGTDQDMPRAVIPPNNSADDTGCGITMLQLHLSDELLCQGASIGS